ncbi:uncharacterized protein LOC128994725 [Macrosteles quadrilineatus]|uniref:uncharacterized protein LOC128994725 n=1 Tax=Macrosteles quadrilineatus TaxID=74068 RepID=UPI0023E166B7|nr:uncharacterized protein LOC128994725 [Macrosteles quadrilineatus]
MRSLLWILLIFGTSLVSSDQDLSSMALVPYEGPPKQTPSQQADTIYDKQKECDAIVGELVIKALDKGDSFSPPFPNERYVKCMDFLDEKKREYITSNLEGLGYYLNKLPVILTSKQEVILPPPADLTLPINIIEFNIQQELCVTNNVCLKLVNLKFSHDQVEDLEEQKKSVTRCLNFLNVLKLKYIQDKKIDADLLRGEGRGLDLVCTNQKITLMLPKKTDDSKVPEDLVKNISKDSDNGNTDKSTKQEGDSDKTYKAQYDEVVKELKTEFSKNSNDQTPEHEDSHEELPLESEELPEEHEDYANQIALKERDCEELLQWGEQPGLTRSVTKFRQLHDNCIEDLEKFKRAHLKTIK